MPTSARCSNEMSRYWPSTSRRQPSSSSRIASSTRRSAWPLSASRCIASRASVCMPSPVLIACAGPASVHSAGRSRRRRALVLDVVVEQREGVHQLDGGGRGRGGRGLATDQLGRQQQRRGAQQLARGAVQREPIGVLPAEVVAHPAEELDGRRAHDLAHLRLHQRAVALHPRLQRRARLGGRAHATSSAAPRPAPGSVGGAGAGVGTSASRDSSAASTAGRENSSGR